jgi:hypothetical protein
MNLRRCNNSTGPQSTAPKYWQSAAMAITSFTSCVNHTEEVAAMNKSVDELHNHEDFTSFKDGLLFYIGLVLVIGVVGLIFWSAF